MGGVGQGGGGGEGSTRRAAWTRSIEHREHRVLGGAGNRYEFSRRYFSGICVQDFDFDSARARNAIIHKHAQTGACTHTITSRYFRTHILWPFILQIKGR